MSDVIEHDFGKDHREAARRYARLAGLVDAQAEAFINDPSAFFADACERIEKRDAVIRAARDALRVRTAIVSDDAPIRPHNIETINVLKAEWDNLQACAAIIRAARD